jgi:hypothetical protein
VKNPLILIALSVGMLCLSGTSDAADLIHQYYFTNELSVIDSVGTADGVLQGGATISNGALNLNGSGQFVQFSTYLIPTGTNSYGVSLTVTDNAPTALAEIISQGGKTGGGPFYIGTAGANIRLTDQHQGTGITMPTGLTTLLYLFTEGNQKLFINGNLVFSGSGNYTMDSGDTYTRLGAQFGGFGEYWNGTISQVKIYNNITASDLATGAVPEPSTYALIGIGALALMVAHRRKVAQ